MRIKSYNEGQIDAYQRIIDWIKENRSTIELEAGINIYRDHFDSESLINFIEEQK